MIEGQGTGKICSLKQGFVIWRLIFMYFTIPGVKKIVRYIEAFVTYRLVISRFHCNLSEKAINDQTKKIYIILLITFHHSTIEKMIAKTLDLVSRFKFQIQKLADSYARFTGYVWTKALFMYTLFLARMLFLRPRAKLIFQFFCQF